VIRVSSAVAETAAAMPPPRNPRRDIRALTTLSNVSFPDVLHTLSSSFIAFSSP
jgi:hypothetical protein